MSKDDDNTRCPHCKSSEYTSPETEEVIIGGVLQIIYRCWKCKKTFSERVA
jgi:transposase-like protein